MGEMSLELEQVLIAVYIYPIIVDLKIEPSLQLCPCFTQQSEKFQVVSAK